MPFFRLKLKETDDSPWRDVYSCTPDVIYNGCPLSVAEVQMLLILPNMKWKDKGLVLLLGELNRTREVEAALRGALAETQAELKNVRQAAASLLAAHGRRLVRIERYLRIGPPRPTHEDENDPSTPG